MGMISGVFKHLGEPRGIWLASHSGFGRFAPAPE